MISKKASEGQHGNIVAKKRDYNYTTLEKCEVGGDTVNVYAVILDATYPHKSNKTDKWVVSFKLADLTSKFDSKGIAETVSLVCFGAKFDDLPVCQRIGEVIRVHRAAVGTWQGSKQLTANVAFSSSWAIFNPISFQRGDEMMPKAFYGNSFQSNRAQQKLVRDLRKWTATNFEKRSVLQTKWITPLSQVKAKGAPHVEGQEKRYYDFDLQVKIIQLFQIDDYVSEVRVIDDSDEIWHCQCHNRKFRYLKEGQYVRIRGATLMYHDKDYERTFGLRPFSNILCLPYPCQLAQDMLFDEHNEKLQFELQQLSSQSTIMHPIMASQITEPKLRYTALSSLKDLTEKAVKGESIDPEQPHRVRFCVGGIQMPKDISKCVKFYDAKKNDVKDANSKTTIKGKNESLVLELPLLVKDQSTMMANAFTRVHLVVQQTGDQKGTFDGFFRDVSPMDILKSKDAQKRIQTTLDLLQKFNVWLEATVKINQDGLIMISDETQLKAF